MTSEERSARIRQIRSLPLVLRNAVKGLSDRQLDTPYRTGGWTIRQVVHHLADSHMNAFVRMKLILTEDHPTLKPYNQDAWAGLPDGNASPVEASLSMIDGLHERWATLLESVGEAGWQRTAMHPETGTITLEHMLRIYSDHGEKHVATIAGLRSSRGW